MIPASAVALAVVVVGCADNRCDFTNIRDHPSPDGRMEVTAFEYCCYDTTGYDTHLQLRSRGTKLRVPGNISTVAFGEEFAVSWSTASNVIIGVTGRVLDATNISGITVTFTKLPPRN